MFTRTSRTPLDRAVSRLDSLRLSTFSIHNDARILSAKLRRGLADLSAYKRLGKDLRKLARKLTEIWNEVNAASEQLWHEIDLYELQFWQQRAQIPADELWAWRPAQVMQLEKLQLHYLLDAMQDEFSEAEEELARLQRKVDRLAPEIVVRKVRKTTNQGV